MDISPHSKPSLLSTFSHTAVWAGLYLTGAVVCVAQISGIDRLVAPRVKIIAAAFAFCTAVGVYLLDRVKLRDAWLDPADEQANAARFAFISGHAVYVRGAMWLLLATATWLGAKVLA
ncbi:MAG TPA: hypothetical protein VFC46_01565, partial [Humisphaera sp.]|nr:hypothetical protein [Humisphaera sp.]